MMNSIKIKCAILIVLALQQIHCATIMSKSLKSHQPISGQDFSIQQSIYPIQLQLAAMNQEFHQDLISRHIPHFRKQHNKYEGYLESEISRDSHPNKYDEEQEDKELEKQIDKFLEVMGPGLFPLPFFLFMLPFAIPAIPLILSRNNDEEKTEHHEANNFVNNEHGEPRILK